MSNNHILFFSNYCNHSKEFIERLYKSGLYDKFTRICVDDNKYKIPPQIQSVPAVIVPDYDYPLEGEDAFNWIEQLSQNNSQTSGIEAYDCMNMSGFSDSFCSLTNDTPLDHAFSFIGRGEFSIQTPEEDNGGGGMNGNGGRGNMEKSDLEKNYDKLMQQRSLEIKSAIKRI